MKYQVHITERAQRDLESAADYIEYTLLNPTAADELLDAAEDALASLSDMPQRIMLVTDEVLAAWGIRFILVKNYLGFYVIDEARQVVHIIRFLYMKRDWQAILRCDAASEEPRPYIK